MSVTHGRLVTGAPGCAGIAHSCCSRFFLLTPPGLERHMAPPYTEVAEQIRHHALILLAAAQSGLAYASDPYDRQRYEQVRRIAEELMGLVSNGELEQVRRIVCLDSGYMTPKVDVQTHRQYDRSNGGGQIPTPSAG